MQQAFSKVFRLRDGSQLAGGDSETLNAMVYNIKRLLLGISPSSTSLPFISDIQNPNNQNPNNQNPNNQNPNNQNPNNQNLNHNITVLMHFVRTLPDMDLMRVLLLAVAGDFIVDHSPSAIQQRCAVVVDPGSGGLVLRDNNASQSVILDVLLIVSIVFLLKAWGGEESKEA